MKAARIIFYIWTLATAIAAITLLALRIRDVEDSRDQKIFGAIVIGIAQAILCTFFAGRMSQTTLTIMK